MFLSKKDLSPLKINGRSERTKFAKHLKKLLKNNLRVEHYLLYSIFPFSAQKASSCDRQRTTLAVPPSLDEHIEIPSGASHFSNDSGHV